MRRHQEYYHNHHRHHRYHRHHRHHHHHYRQQNHFHLHCSQSHSVSPCPPNLSCSLP
ncbi:hypothetical protein E2C01_099109 [Portunus trituberculatus]|uniref:Uncharacterized protein n=1 Tax=Portunus trituberculatus TaxID=210409 RepID=A0A5B7KEJ9_PORTR|nr:hypothetical protein [Portunus trituberculatus]